MEVTETGSNLSVVIDCEYCVGHHWMAFSAWYSVYKNLPEAEVFILCRRKPCNRALFSWTNKCNVPFFALSANEEAESYVKRNGLISGKPHVVPAHVVAIRGYGQDEPTFVDYWDGLGLFNTALWIDRVDPPFENALSKFYKAGMDADGRRVLEMWSKMYGTYRAVS